MSYVLDQLLELAELEGFAIGEERARPISPNWARKS